MEVEDQKAFGPLARNLRQEFAHFRLALQSQSTTRSASQFDSDPIDDAFGLYQLWAGNFGAFRSPGDARSLDYRLRCVPAVARRLFEILEELRSLLRDASSILAGDEYMKDAYVDTVSEAEDVALAAELLEFTTSADCQAAQTTAGINDAVRRLSSVSMLAAKSHGRDHFARAEADGKPRFDNQYDIAHVREYVKARKGQADSEESLTWLLERLGRAITKRREVFRYYCYHEERMSQEDPLWRQHEDGQHAEIAVVKYKFQGTKPTTAPSGPSRVQTQATTLLPGAECIEDGFDEGDASTLASTVWFKQGPNSLRIPPLSTYGTPGKPFVCPFCRKLARFNGNRGWRTHVRSDLRPFICTAPNCGLLFFADRRSWQDHEMSQHRRTWSCSSCRSGDFATSAVLQDHLREQHDIDLDEERLHTMMHAYSQPLRTVNARDCPLCDWESELERLNKEVHDVPIAVTITQFMRHLGNHLEQLALFSLPKASPDGLESNAVEGVQDEQASRHKLSTLTTFSSREVAVSRESAPSPASVVVFTPDQTDDNAPQLHHSQAADLSDPSSPRRAETFGNDTSEAHASPPDDKIPQSLSNSVQDDVLNPWRPDEKVVATSPDRMDQQFLEPYPCRHTGCRSKHKPFMTPSARNKHELIHSAYRCEACKRKFISQQSLDEHQTTCNRSKGRLNKDLSLSNRRIVEENQPGYTQGQGQGGQQNRTAYTRTSASALVSSVPSIEALMEQSNGANTKGDPPSSKEGQSLNDKIQDTVLYPMGKRGSVCDDSLRLLKARQKQAYGPQAVVDAEAVSQGRNTNGDHALQDYQMQPMMLKHQNNEAESQGNTYDKTVPRDFGRMMRMMGNIEAYKEAKSLGNNNDELAPQDYQMQLMLLEQQDPKLLLRARQQLDKESSAYRGYLDPQQPMQTEDLQPLVAAGTSGEGGNDNNSFAGLNTNMDMDLGDDFDLS